MFTSEQPAIEQSMFQPAVCSATQTLQDQRLSISQSRIYKAVSHILALTNYISVTYLV